MKKFLKLLIALIIILVPIYVFMIQVDIVVLKDTFNYKEEIRLSDIVEVKNAVLEDRIVDTTTSGSHEIFFFYKNHLNKRLKESIVITIKEEVKKESIKPVEIPKKEEVNNGLTYIDGILIVNKTYSLPSTYNPGLNQEASLKFNEMKAAALKENVKLWIASGFRSYSYQNNLYNRYVKKYGKANTDTFSARPGHSEHQSGLAMDINSLEESFALTKEGKWLNENAANYGFIIRYPKGKTHLTGYKFEPWHIRYVGKELSKKLYNNGDWITLEEHFNITSAYND